MKGTLEEDYYIQLNLNAKDLRKLEDSPLECKLGNKKRLVLEINHSFKRHYISSSQSNNTYNITINESCQENLKRDGIASGTGGEGEKIKLIYAKI